jgi:hypothetical protein
MPDKCPLCGQVLPAAMEERVLHNKLEKLKSSAAQAALESQRKKLQEGFESELIATREVARQQAEREFRKELRESREALAKVEERLEAQVEKARKLGASQAERSMKGQLEDLNRQLRDAEKQRAAEVKRVKEQAANAAREHAEVRHTVELSRLQTKVDELNRQLEKKSGEQFGEEGELDLLTELEMAFPRDKIERVTRGVKGADIVHLVMDGDEEAGRIVYESKNVSAWQNAFITQAKKYRTQYETPYVMVVSRVFPKKQRGMCEVDDVPVVEPRLATTLAGVMREGILEIAKLRLTKVDADEKAQELFSYVVGNEFQTRFRDVADAVEKLTESQKCERTWHENNWTKQSLLHARIESRHREINAKLQSIAKDGITRRPMAFAAGRD